MPLPNDDVSLLRGAGHQDSLRERGLNILIELHLENTESKDNLKN